MEIPACKDMTQGTKQIRDVPEIRVWCHPHKIGMKGEDYFQVFTTFKEAFRYINEDRKSVV